MMILVSNLAPIYLISFAIFIRWLVAQFPYSGQATPPMFGDYEAQRHWMEVTTNIPIQEWYQNTTDNDLNYWGLDYPPLTAYHMYLLGQISNRYINSTWTELHKSRGIEGYEHKLYMRSSVIVVDVIIYMSAIIYFFYKTPQTTYSSPPHTSLRQNVIAYSSLALLYPGQILIDHGHFQYNCVFMGLVLWAIIFMTKGRQFVASMIFTLALNYKQMSIYYSLPFFWLIVSWNLRVRPIWKGIVNILLVGCLVISTFAILFYPFSGNIEGIQAVVRRIFPFNRGIFEDKVANFWFSLSIFYKFKNLYSAQDVLKASAFMTLILSLPAGVHLLFKPAVRNFKYALVNVSLVFFLVSYQVHEKTILVPALPILLLFREHPMAVSWFSIISTFSLMPLLMRDGQTIPYLVLMITYTLLCLENLRNLLTSSSPSLFSLDIIKRVSFFTSIIGCFVLSFAALLVKPTSRYPHIHPTINALYSCAHLIMFLFFFYTKQMIADKRTTTTNRIILLKKSK